MSPIVHKKPARRRDAADGAGGFSVWAAVGIGVCVSACVYLGYVLGDKWGLTQRWIALPLAAEDSPQPLAVRVQGSAAVPAKPTEPAGPVAQFEFYTMLPDMEVQVSDADTPAGTGVALVELPRPAWPAAQTPAASEKDSKKHTRPSQTAPTQPAGAQFVLQLAAFTQYADAERLRIQVVQRSGLPMQIHSARLPDGSVRYRVRSPAYSDKAQAEADRLRLRHLAIRSILLTQSG